MYVLDTMRAGRVRHTTGADIKVDFPTEVLWGYGGEGVKSRGAEISTFEEKVERDRAVAPPMASERRLRRTVRGPSTPAADAAGLGSIGDVVAVWQLLLNGFKLLEWPTVANMR